MSEGASIRAYFSVDCSVSLRFKNLEMNFEDGLEVESQIVH